MKLDVQSEIFQNLNGALDEVKVKFKGRSSYLYNMKTGSLPFIIHGNGPIKVSGCIEIECQWEGCVLVLLE